MPLYGLIGKKLSHSFSAKYFTDKFLREGITNSSYHNFELAHIAELKNVLEENADLAGLNVTVPYKQVVINYCNQLSLDAEAIGAVNVLKILREGTSVALKGYNSDHWGFSQSLFPLLKQHHKQALILGTGGSSKAVAYALKQLGIAYRFVSRNPFGETLPYHVLNASVLNQFQIIINTTPLGMFPDLDEVVEFPFQLLTKEHLAVDLIYNPLKTRFLAEAEKRGAEILNGLNMLFMQAEKSWQIWNNNDS